MRLASEIQVHPDTVQYQAEADENGRGEYRFDRLRGALEIRRQDVPTARRNALTITRKPVRTAREYVPICRMRPSISSVEEVDLSELMAVCE